MTLAQIDNKIGLVRDRCNLRGEAMQISMWIKKVLDFVLRRHWLLCIKSNWPLNARLSIGLAALNAQQFVANLKPMYVISCTD